MNPPEPPRRAGRSLALTHLTGDTMTEQSDLIPDLDSEDAFEVQMRGYSRRQVNEFVARSRSQTRDLEERLSRSIDEVERLRTEVSASRQREMEDKPAHQELSERMAQILKLADDEARAQKARALEDITQQRNDAKQEIDRLKAEAREQTERMLAAAQEQAENTIATARSEAEKARTSARNEAERTISDAQKKSENAVAAAQAQAKQMLDEATARATAIHDGAERRLNLLVARHTETVRRLTEVRDVVTNLVAGEAARGSLEEEVARSVASAVSGNGGGNGTARTGGAPERPAHARGGSCGRLAPRGRARERRGGRRGGPQPPGRAGTGRAGAGRAARAVRWVRVGQPGRWLHVRCPGPPGGQADPPHRGPRHARQPRRAGRAAGRRRADDRVTRPDLIRGTARGPRPGRCACQRPGRPVLSASSLRRITPSRSAHGQMNSSCRSNRSMTASATMAPATSWPARPRDTPGIWARSAADMPASFSDSLVRSAWLSRRRT